MQALFSTFQYISVFYQFREGMRLRIACCTLVYRKALRLSRGALGDTTIGQMVNLMSNDVNRFDVALVCLPYLIVGPIQTALAVILLWPYLGYITITGVVFLFILVIQ